MENDILRYRQGTEACFIVGILLFLFLKIQETASKIHKYQLFFTANAQLLPT